MKCNQDPHFPAKCTQTSNYHKQLEKSVDLVPETTSKYLSQGKRCPYKDCNTYMEKDFGCNHMICGQCNRPFCWNCLKEWSEHLTLNSGSYSCKNEENSNIVEIEFRKKMKKNKKRKENETKYTNSVNHRLSRTRALRKEKLAAAKRILYSLNYVDSVEFSQRQKFLKEMAEFVMELHFICEYSYVALWDNNSEMRLSISHAIKTIELVIFQINQIFESGKGIDAVEKLKILFNRGLTCIKLLQKVRAN